MRWLSAGRCLRTGSAILLVVALAVPGVPFPIGAATAAPSAAADYRLTTRVSVAGGGAQGNKASSRPAVSADGRFVAFKSSAINLVAGDTNGREDVFVHDRETGETTRVSVATGGAQSSGGMDDDRLDAPAISADGRFVAFSSQATDLVPGDTNGVHDVFVHDRETKVTTRVSVATGGAQANGFSRNPSISADGRYVAFQSDANNLVSGEERGAKDVFVHDRTTGKTTRVSVATDGTEANGHSDKPSISADGRYVAFVSDAINLEYPRPDTNFAEDVFVHDRQDKVTTRVSVSSEGAQGNNDAKSGSPAISADGRYVAFWSDANNLVPDDTNDASDVFVHDRTTKKTTRVSLAFDGTQSIGGAQSGGVPGYELPNPPAISADGRYVAFESSATNLVPGETQSAGGVFAHDRITGETVRVSVTSDGVQGNSASLAPSISADGSYLAFESYASNLVSGDTNGVTDIFAHGWLFDSSAPVVTGLASASHGAVGAWSKNRNVAFNWNATPDVSGYSYSWSTDPVVEPDEAISTTGTSHAQSGVSDGVWYFKVRARSTAGVWGRAATLRVRIDGTAPTGDIKINSGAPYTTTPAVWLISDVEYAVAGPHPAQAMRVSLDGGSTWGAWVAYATSTPIRLPGGDGTKTVKAEFKDAAGNVATLSTSIILAIQPPSGTIKINGGASATNSPNVTVAHTPVWGAAGAGQMRHSVDGGKSWSAWQPYAATKSLTLPGGDGPKTVKAEFKDAAGNVSASPIEATIVFDTTPPTGTIKINGGAATTASREVAVTSEVDFGPSRAGQMRHYSANGEATATWGPWEPYAATKSLTLPDGDGTKTVKAEFKDAAGNVSASPIEAIIFLDTSLPAVTGLTSSSHGTAGAWNKSRNVSLAWDATPNATGYSYSWSTDPDAVPDETVDTAATTRQVTNAADGTWHFKVRAKRQDGVWGPAASLMVRIDATAPTGTMKIDGGAAATASRNVTVTNTVAFALSDAHPDGAVRYDAGEGWGDWEPCVASKFLTLPEGDGAKTVKAEFRDAAGNIAAKSASIVLDTAPVPSRKIEEDAAGVTFDRFVTGKSASYSGGGYIYGRWAGTRLQVRFSGTTIRWFGPRQPNYGMADVYVDGVKKGTADAYAAAGSTGSVEIFQVTGLTDAPHTLEVRITGQKNPASTATIVVFDYFEVHGASASAGTVRIDELSGTLAGPWVRGNNPTYYGGAYHYSRYPSASFKASFTGTKVVWIGPKTGAYGRANVFIDGKLQGTVSQRGTMGWRERVWESKALKPGKHTIEIRPTGTKDPASKSANVVIDALDVTE